MNNNTQILKRSILVPVSVIMLLSAQGCGKSDGGDKVLASVGGARITVSDFTKKIKSLPDSYRKIARKKREQFLEDIINDQLLYQEAMRKGINRDKETRDLIKEAEKKILITRLLEEEVSDKVTVSEEDVEAFYEKNSDRFMTPEVMRVSHILVPSRKEADDIVQELERGRHFEELARERSLDPTAQTGGDVGYFPRGQLMPEFDEASAKLQIGEISPPVKTKLGYHVIMLTDRRAPQPLPLERVEDDIRRSVFSMKRQSLFMEMLEDLKEKKKIKINTELLAELDDIIPGETEDGGR